MNRTVFECAARAAFFLGSVGISFGAPVMTSFVEPATAAPSQEAQGPVSASLKKADDAVAAIVAVPDGKRSLVNTLAALDDLLVRLDSETAWQQFMAHVSTDAEQRNAGQAAEEQVSNWKIDLFKREDLFKAIRAFADTHPPLEGEPKRLLAEVLRDFRRAGMELTPAKREELTKIQKEVTKLGLEFEKNIREDETMVPLTVGELDGLPADFFEGLKKVGDVYLVGMASPIFSPIMEQAKNETTREKVWVAYKRRGGTKNVALIEQIVKLRADAAKLLGYPTSADYEIEIRMAKNAQTVREFYDKLRPIVRKKAKLDLDEFTAAKREDTKNAKAILQPWDQPYYENYLRKTRYAVDSEKVREYFSFDNVMQGLFSVTQSLYGLEYREVTKDAASKGPALWHPDARMYEVWDKAANKHIGDFYIDLFPRENKYSHAACWGLIPRKKWADGTVQMPVAALVCNFPKPTADKPALWQHKDVETMFHEFGHVLHNLLTEADYGWFAGSNVARDFVEAPSQMFENWVWDGDVLKTFAKHYKSGEPIPAALVDGMLKAKHLGSGLFAERQFYYGLTDLTFHTAADGKIDSRKAAGRAVHAD
jgi:thimet oligopeptidase